MPTTSILAHIILVQKPSNILIEPTFMVRDLSEMTCCQRLSITEVLLLRMLA